MELIQKQTLQIVPLVRHPNAAPAGEIASISHDSECAICGGTGWQRIEIGNLTRCKRCDCVRTRIIREKLAAIPERFRDRTFESYQPENPNQAKALELMQINPEGSYFLCGPYGCGKTHLLYAQYRSLALAGVHCHVRTSTELLSELQRMEFDPEFASPVFLSCHSQKQYHLFWDDVDKFKMTDFKSQGLFDLIDAIYRNALSLTLTSNYTLKELVELEKLHPAQIRRIDEICKAVEL
jgi:DNA replication protein DnaC